METFASQLNATLPVGSRQYNSGVITLSENEERLVEALRALPPDAADQVMTWTIRLGDLAKGKDVDWGRHMEQGRSCGRAARVLVQI